MHALCCLRISNGNVVGYFLIYSQPCNKSSQRRLNVCISFDKPSVRTRHSLKNIATFRASLHILFQIRPKLSGQLLLIYDMYLIQKSVVFFQKKIYAGLCISPVYLLLIIVFPRMLSILQSQMKLIIYSVLLSFLQTVLFLDQV